MLLRHNFTEVSSKLELIAAPHSNREAVGSNPCERVHCSIPPRAAPSNFHTGDTPLLLTHQHPTAHSKMQPRYSRTFHLSSQLLLSPAPPNTARPRASTHRSVPQLHSAGSRPAAHRPPSVAPSPQADDARPRPTPRSSTAALLSADTCGDSGGGTAPAGATPGHGRSSRRSLPEPFFPPTRTAALTPRGNHDFFPLCAAPEYAPRRHRARMDPKSFSPRPSARGSVMERPTVPPRSPSASHRGLRRLPGSGPPGCRLRSPRPAPRSAPRALRRRAPPGSPGHAARRRAVDLPRREEVHRHRHRTGASRRHGRGRRRRPTTRRRGPRGGARAQRADRRRRRHPAAAGGAGADPSAPASASARARGAGRDAATPQRQPEGGRAAAGGPAANRSAAGGARPCGGRTANGRRGKGEARGGSFGRRLPIGTAKG